MSPSRLQVFASAISGDQATDTWGTLQRAADIIAAAASCHIRCTPPPSMLRYLSITWLWSLTPVCLPRAAASTSCPLHAATSRLYAARACLPHPQCGLTGSSAPLQASPRCSRWYWRASRSSPRQVCSSPCCAVGGALHRTPFYPNVRVNPGGQDQEPPPARRCTCIFPLNRLHTRVQAGAASALPKHVVPVQPACSGTWQHARHTCTYNLSHSGRVHPTRVGAGLPADCNFS